MSEIARSGKWNPGGGRWLEVVPAVAVSSYARPSSAHAPVIALHEGWEWTRIYCTPGTISYRETPQREANGLFYQFDIKGFSPADTAAKRQALENLLIYEGMLVRFCDNDGLTRIAGNPTEFLRFGFDLGTEEDVPGKRGYALSISGTTTQSAAYA